jgi:alpha,alpha-trehalase
MGREISGRIKKDLTRRLKEAEKIIFFLDYDGTLTPIRKKPGLAGIDKGTKALLKKLAGKKWAEVFIISGRTLKNIKGLIGLRQICYSGNHGIELEGPGFKYVNPTARALRPHIQKCFRLLRKKLKIKGALLENKFYTLSVHYRLVASGDIPELKRVFRDAVGDLRKNKKLRITHGKKVFEVRPNIRWHKGKIVSRILGKIKTRRALPVYIGDDVTDEDAFKALGRRGISVLVSGHKRKTAARYRLNSSGDVRGLLKFILRIRE